MRPLRLFALFVGGMVVQWWWTTHFALAGVAPQVLLVLTVIIAAALGPVRGMFFGFGWGLFLDVMSAHLFGGNALALTVAAYGAGMVRRQLDVRDLAPQCMVVFFMTWAYFLLIGVLGAMFIKSFEWVGWPSFLADPFYNCLVAAVAYPFWGSYLETRG